MRYFFKDLAILLMATAHYVQSFLPVPLQRKLSEDDNPPVYDTVPVIHSKIMIAALRWVQRQRRTIEGRARIQVQTKKEITGMARIIAAPEPKPLTPEQIADQAEGDAILEALGNKS